VLQLAAESHVDRSIEGPGDFIESDVSGTFQLLQAIRLPLPPHQHRRGVWFAGGYGALLGDHPPDDPRSPYTASKAASDHLVSAWHNTYAREAKADRQAES
jgi:dTDP-glucose 4,6-dehydratase